MCEQNIGTARVCINCVVFSHISVLSYLLRRQRHHGYFFGCLQGVVRVILGSVGALGMLISCSFGTDQYPVVASPQFGRTALIEASVKGHTATVQALIGAGADLNLQNRVSDRACLHKCLCCVRTNVTLLCVCISCVAFCYFCWVVLAAVLVTPSAFFSNIYAAPAPNLKVRCSACCVICYRMAGRRSFPHPRGVTRRQCRR
jgi:hypothetical protein